MSYNDSDDYLDSIKIEEFEIRSDALSPALKTEFDYELQYTHASRFLSEEVIIINWEEWKQFCRFLPERRRTEAEKEQQNSNLILNSNLVSRLDNLDTKLDTILQEQNKEMKEKDRKNGQLIQELQNERMKNQNIKAKYDETSKFKKSLDETLQEKNKQMSDKDLQNSHLKQELHKEKMKNQNIKEKLEETSKLKQIKRLLHKIQNQKSWTKKQPQDSRNRASKPAAAKVKQRLCYCCRRKGHLAKDCTFSSTFGSPGPSNPEPVVVNSVFCVRNDIPVSEKSVSVAGNSVSISNNSVSVAENCANVSATSNTVSGNSANFSTSGTVVQVLDKQSRFIKVVKMVRNSIRCILGFYLFCLLMKIALVLIFPP